MMTDNYLTERNQKIIEKIGLGNAFTSLCAYICEEDLREWQGYILDKFSNE